MINIILVAIAVVCLIVAGLLLAKGHKKEEIVETDVDKAIKEQTFNTKYDEINHLYKSGAIKEDEYKNQMKNIIN